MVGKNLCKLSLGALACLSIAFSGFAKDVLKVDAATSDWSEGYSQGYSEGYDEGYGDGESAGYSDGFLAGAATTVDIPQTITLRYDSQYAINVVGYVNSEYPTFSLTLDDNNTVYTMQRLPSDRVLLKFSTSSQDWPYLGFRAYVDNVTYVLNWSMVANDYIYCPTWVSNIVIDVWATNDNLWQSQFDGLRFDSSQYSYVRFGTNTGLADIYDEGYRDGREDGYDSGMEAGASAGRSEGYSNGYGAGYSAGLAAGGGSMQVIDIWGLMSAVITMPFTFFSQGLDWTLFAGSPYEFSVSIFFGSLLVILMLWKIIQLIMGLGK